MKRLALLLPALVLGACDIAFGPAPTPTSTPAFPALQPSQTVAIYPPTDLPVGVPLNMEGVTNPTAAALPAQSEFRSDMATPDLSQRPVLVTVPLDSGAVLNAELWLPSGQGIGVLLLGNTFEGWAGFPAILRDRGYAVMTVEGGLADSAVNVRTMLDVMAAQPNINPATMLLVGAETGADAALIGCALDSRCGGAVLLSPQDGAALEDAMNGYNPRPVLLTASEEDSASLRAAERVRRLATGSAVLQPFEGAGRGAQILHNRPDMITLIGDFLDTVTGR